jgi:hypothetical protein
LHVAGLRADWWLACVRLVTYLAWLVAWLVTWLATRLVTLLVTCQLVTFQLAWLVA